MKNYRTLLPPKLQELMNAARDKASQLKAGVQQAPGVCQVSVWSMEAVPLVFSTNSSLPSVGPAEVTSGSKLLNTVNVYKDRKTGKLNDCKDWCT